MAKRRAVRSASSYLLNKTKVMIDEPVKWRRWANPDMSTEPLCGVAIPGGGIPLVFWYCAKLGMSSTNIEDLNKLNGNCPGCITEAHKIGKCETNPHRNIING